MKPSFVGSNLTATSDTKRPFGSPPLLKRARAEWRMDTSGRAGKADRDDAEDRKVRLPRALAENHALGEPTVRLAGNLGPSRAKIAADDLEVG